MIVPFILIVIMKTGFIHTETFNNQQQCIAAQRWLTQQADVKNVGCFLK